MNAVSLGVLLVVTIVLAFALVALYRQSHTLRGGTDMTLPLQNLTAVIQAGQTQDVIVAEKLAHLEPIVQVTNSVQVELRGLVERVSTLERTQGNVGQGLQTLQASLHTELAQARVSLAELQTHAHARTEIEQHTAESVRRLEAVIAGTHSKGAAGENILDVVFAKLPIEWQVRDFKVGNKVVEFALRLPNNLLLPIDSKWAATSLLEQFVASQDIAEQQRLKVQIESAVLGKAREVKKYIDPNLTVGFGIAAVPDAVYDLCSGIQCACYEHNVVLVAYSMFVPYLLLVFQTVLKTSQNINLEKLDACVQAAQNSIQAAQQELEGRFARALTMLNNSRDDMSVHLSKVNSSLTSLQINAVASQIPSATVDATIANLDRAS